MFSPEVVVTYLAKEFGCCELTRAPSRKEKKIIDSFTAILREAVYESLEIESEEEMTIEEVDDDTLWAGEHDDSEDEKIEGRGDIRFGDVEVQKEMVEKAIRYYRSSDQGYRSLSAMNRRFRFIRSPYHLRKLRQIEEEGRIRGDRLVRLRTLAEQLRDVVFLKFQKGISLHDSDIRQLALKMNKDEFLVENFTASPFWIKNFKKNYGIVSRRITTFASRRSFLCASEIASRAQTFVLEVKKEMESWPRELVCNADQSGFTKEMYTARTLAPKGVRKVERVVQSKSAIQHSFTIMPLIYADGHLGKKLFVVFQEPHGMFPQRGHFQTPNLEVRSNTTHIMNKELLHDWVKSCVGSAESPASTLLIVDSWTAFKDHPAMQSAMPHGKQIKIMNIPAGTTSQIQPLDVYFFMPFKCMYKRIGSYVAAHEIDYRVDTRDSIIRILSLVYSQFCAPRFKSFLSYSWYASGYIDEHPAQFLTPVQYCFPSNLVGTCQVENCEEEHFIRCAYCERLFCFEHFIVVYHVCAMQ